MTHHIHHQDAEGVEQVLLYLFLSGFFGFVIGVTGTVITFFFPDMTAEGRTLVAFILIIISSTVPLWGAGLLNVWTFAGDALIRWVTMRRTIL